MVTGAGGGIGKALSLDLADCGADLVLACNKSVESSLKIADNIRALGRRAIIVQGDISNPDDCRRMVEEANAQYEKPIQILINNAGYFYDISPLLKMSDEQIGKTIDINLKGTMYVTREVCRHIVDAGLPGRVINISSGAGHFGRVNFSNYCASKAGVLGFTRAIALELARKKINVNSISVGYVEVGLWDKGEERNAVKDSIIPRILLRRPGSPRDISRLACFLVSECGDWITGSDFIVDGGESCGRVPFSDNEE